MNGKGKGGNIEYQTEKSGNTYFIYEVVGKRRKLVFQSKNRKEWEVEIRKLRS